MSEFKNRGLYFEEFKVGQVFYSTARTITETDIVMFAGLSGDYNQIHTDVEYCKTTPFGQRIAHGLLVMSIASGLIAQSGFLDGTVISFREIKDWKFVKTTFIGDTVHVITKVIETKSLKRVGGGLIVISLDVRNQNDETLMKGKWTALMANKPQ
jgi:acyl dehydratase